MSQLERLKREKQLLDRAIAALQRLQDLRAK